MSEQAILGENNNPFERAIRVNLADDGFVDMASARGNGGFGFAQLGDGTEWAQFSFTSAGVVTLVENSANVVNTDTDTKFCIFDSGAVPRFKNRLGSVKNLLVVYWLS
jgi:hypothetical protein